MEAKNNTEIGKIVKLNGEHHLLSSKVEEWSCQWDYPAYYHVDAAGDEFVITKNTFKPNPRFSRKILKSTDKTLGVPELTIKEINIEGL